MDMFLLGTVLFLLANLAVVIAMLRRVNLHNDSVLAWEQAQVAVTQPVLVQSAPVVSQQAYTTVYLAEAA